MDTSSCVMGVERFVFRRATPAMIWSDNGTNFIGAEKELRECMEKWNTLNIATELAQKALSGRLIHPVRHTKVASGRGYIIVLKEYGTLSSVRVASQMRC